MNRKKFFALILSGILTFPSGIVYAGSQSGSNDYLWNQNENLKDTNQNLQKELEDAKKQLETIKEEEDIKKLVLEYNTIFPDLEQGKSADIRLQVSNKGPANLRGVSIEVSALPTGVSLKSGSTSDEQIGELNVGDSKEASYSLEVGKNAETGNYPISFKLTGNYGLNTVKTYETTKTFYIKVVKNENQKNDKALSPIKISNIKHPGTIEKGQVANFSFNVTNPNSESINSVKVTVTPEEGLVNRTQNTFIINNMKSGETVPLSVNFFAKDGAERKNYSINVTAEGVSQPAKEGEENTQKQLPTSSQYSGIYYNAPLKDDEKKDGENGVKNPHILITSYDFGGSHVTPSEEFTLSMNFINTSREKMLRNIKISLSAEESSFIPVNSSNSFFIDSLAPNQAYSKAIRFTTKADATTKTVPVSIKYDYEDTKGNALTSEEVISIPVIQKTDFSIDEIRPPIPFYEGEPVTISVSFYNLGKTQISNLKVTSEGSFSPDGEVTYFSGNMDSGKSDSYSLRAFPNDPSKIDGKIIFTYDSVDGQNHKIEKDFSFDLEPMPAPTDEENMQIEEPKKFPIIPAIGVAITVLILGVAIYKRQKRKKEEAEFDLDE